LENPIPHINVLAKFNQNTSESTHERRNRLQRERRARQRIKSTEPSEMSQDEVIVYVDNDELYNKQQHVHNLLLAMTHCNCLETKTRQSWDDGIVEKWTQYVDSAR